MPIVHLTHGIRACTKHFWQQKWFPWGGDLIIGRGIALLLNIAISENRCLYTCYYKAR